MHPIDAYIALEYPHGSSLRNLVTLLNSPGVPRNVQIDTIQRLVFELRYQAELAQGMLDRLVFASQDPVDLPPPLTT